MPLSRASTRGRYSRIEGVTSFVDHILSSVQMFSHVGAPLNHSLLAIHLVRSAKDISMLVLSFKIRSTYFDVVISFKPFNSTGAISFFK